MHPTDDVMLPAGGLARSDAPSTQVEGARAIAGRAKTIRRAAYDAVAASDDGLTDRELIDTLRQLPEFSDAHDATLLPRRIELTDWAMPPLLCDSKTTRDDRQTGKPAIVWRVTTEAERTAALEGADNDPQMWKVNERIRRCQKSLDRAYEAKAHIITRRAAKQERARMKEADAETLPSSECLLRGESSTPPGYSWTGAVLTESDAARPGLWLRTAAAALPTCGNRPQFLARMREHQARLFIFGGRIL